MKYEKSVVELFDLTSESGRIDLQNALDELNKMMDNDQYSIEKLTDQLIINEKADIIRHLLVYKIYKET